MENRNGWQQNSVNNGNTYNRYFKRNYRKRRSSNNMTQRINKENVSQSSCVHQPLHSYQPPTIIIQSAPVVEEKKKFSLSGLLYAVVGLASVGLAIYFITLL